MANNLGVITLLVISLLVYFGIAERVLDRMYLTDKSAFIVIIALIIGSYIDIPILKNNINATLNLGGGLVPPLLAFYLLNKAGTSKEKIRAGLGAILTGLTIYFIGSILMKDEYGEFNVVLDPIYIYPLVGGLIAYIIGRSRRGAFIAATLGVLLLDIIHFFYLLFTRTPGTVHIGGAGAFDSIILSGILAVLLAEFIGEGRERLQGGPQNKGKDPDLLKKLKSNSRREDIDEL